MKQDMRDKLDEGEAMAVRGMMKRKGGKRGKRKSKRHGRY
jgi:hypothetical protein